MTETDLRETASALTSLLAEIDHGDVEATKAQRAFVAGALHGIRIALGEVSSDLSLVE